MPKRIEVFPPSGGEPIEINQEDLASFEAKGWLAEPRKPKKPAKAEIVTPSKGDK